MHVRDIMTPNTHFVPAEASIAEAAGIMHAHDVGFLPVRKGGQLVGVVTDRDLALRPPATARSYDSATVEDVMTPKAHAVRETATVGGAARAMMQKQVRRLLVLDDKSQLLGVLALGDIAARDEVASLTGDVLRHLAASAPQRANRFAEAR